jgi:hypothetical protein
MGRVAKVKRTFHLRRCRTSPFALTRLIGLAKRGAICLCSMEGHVIQTEQSATEDGGFFVIGSFVQNELFLV